MIKFYFDTEAHLLDSSRHIRIHQKINYYTDEAITNQEEALTWSRMFFKNELSASPMFFELTIKKDNEEVNELVKDDEYTMILKESTGRLVGNYEILITSESGSIKKKIMFVDGEAEFDIHLEMKGMYEIDLHEDFYIGSDKYIPLIITQDKINFSLNRQKHGLTFEVI